MSNLNKIVAAIAVAYGLVALGGGVLGFVNKGSLASLIAGGVSGVVLIGAAWLVPRRPMAALRAMLFLSILLVGRFISTAAKAGPNAVATVMIIGGSIVAIVAAVAMFKLRSEALRAS